MDALVVLGHALETDGSMAETLVKRVDFAVDLYRKGISNLLIMSGGLPVNERTEAQNMKEYAVSQGIDAERILIEDQSINTYENAEYTKEILERRKLREIGIITSTVHMPRAQIIFRRSLSDYLLSFFAVDTGSDGADIEKILMDLILQ